MTPFCLFLNDFVIFDVLNKRKLNKALGAHKISNTSRWLLTYPCDVFRAENFLDIINIFLNVTNIWISVWTYNLIDILKLYQIFRKCLCGHFFYCMGI